ncbi:MAG: DUF433 domain-containing protein [Chloroflexi bacterium]|nr:DUF433 domain-containing protein [Chloroflexota bacterium]
MITEAIYRDGILETKRPLNLANHTIVHVQVTDETATDHPHIARQANIHGGRPVVRGTRIPVKTLVRYVNMGMSVPEILAGFPDLTTAQLYDALSYYYDNQAEMEADMAADEPSVMQAKFGLEMDENGRLSPAKS